MAKGTGHNHFRERETLTSLEARVLAQFIEHIKSLPDMPEPAIAEKMLLPEIREAIDIRNNTADKTDQWAKPARLSPYQIASVMCVIDTIRSVSYIEGSNDHSRDVICMYVSEGLMEGLYTFDTSTIRKRIKKYSQSIRMREIDEVLEHLRDMAEKTCVCTEPDFVPVNNGIFNFKTKQLMPFSSEHVFFSKSSTDYNPNAQNVFITMPDGIVWDCDWQMKQMACDDEQLKFHWQMLSASLRPNARLDKAVFPYSESGNSGKGTFLSIFKNLLGPDAYASIQLSKFGKDHELTQLLGKQAILCDENKVGVFVDDASEFKAIVTGDTFSINPKYKDPITTRFSGFVVECLNEFPQIHDRSLSMLRRLIFDPFQQCFTGVERKYIKNDYLKRKEVLEYYLKVALEMEYFEEFAVPKVCEEAMERYRIYNDPVKEFWNAVEPELQWNKQPLGWLYELFKGWFVETHPSGKVISSRRFRMDIVAIATATGRWTCKGLDEFESINNDDMAATEKLIHRYKVEKYMSETHKNSADIEKQCNFIRPKKVRGCLVRVQLQDPKSGIVKDTK